MNDTPIPTERVFSLSCFEGLKIVRKYVSKYPEHNFNELLEIILKVDSNAQSLDLEASIYLHQIVDPACPLVGIEYYQVCIKAVLLTHQPIWAQSMKQGRKRFVSTLKQNDQDIFGAAGLMSESPSTDIVSWWDDVAGHARLLSDIQKMEQAREAERLSIDHEIARLKLLGITKLPEWKGLDDNFAGYDVLSYQPGQHGLQNIKIEVKSTIASPLRFIVTRNEWNEAIKSGNAFIFHIWDMKQQNPILHIRTAEQIKFHIPEDKEKGAWKTAEIPLSVGS
tara:strand:+ start:2121 stop:2960 length:840 start_codon:yes stop_codon:yes gene_type:complete